MLNWNFDGLLNYVPSIFELMDGTMLIIIQDEYGEFITMKIETQYER
jgi:hypothetical protein